MGFRPQPDFERTLIRFEQGKPSSYNVYKEHLQTYLKSKKSFLLFLSVEINYMFFF